MSSNNYYLVKKIAVIGSFGVGKSSLIYSLANNGKFPDKGEIESTIGAAFTQLLVTKRDLVMMNRLNFESSRDMHDYYAQLDDGPIRQIQLWDTAGDEKFRSIIPIYLRNVTLVIICFEASNEKAANEVLMFKDMCKENGIEDNQIILVATKEDQIDRLTGGVYLMPDVMTSAMTGSGIEMLKTLLIYRTLRDTDLGKVSSNQNMVMQSLSDDLAYSENNKGKCC